MTNAIAAATMAVTTSWPQSMGKWLEPAMNKSIGKERGDARKEVHPTY